MKFFCTLAAALFFAAARPAAALDPLPDAYHGPGFVSWLSHQDAKLWAMEKLMEALRNPDLAEKRKAMQAIGFQKLRVGRSLMWPEIEQPVSVETKWLGIDRRKLAVMTMPARGRNTWFMILFRQDSNDEAYWRPVQVLKFDNDPAAPFEISFPDINGEQIYFVQVRHLVKDQPIGVRVATSIFKFDEKQLRLTFQETDGFYRRGWFQGDPTKVEQQLEFKGDQRIRRKVTVRTYPYMKDPEFFKYEDANVTPRKTEKAEERFSWNPQLFSFYHPVDELEKLVRNKSPWIRREAARRLGEIMKTTHPQLEKAMLTDKDAYVRAQAALAIENIGDVKALPSVEKALQKWNEPDNLGEAFQAAFDRLSKLKEEAAKEKESKPKAQKKKPAKKAVEESPIPAAEGPKTSEPK